MNTENLIKREQIAKKICAQLNNFVDLKNTLISIISDLKALTGFDAISIRLHEGDDFPYYVYKGFSDSFIKMENSLCPKVKSNSSEGKPLVQLDCLCGNVISGTVDFTKSYYTQKGSYWTNNSTEITSELLKNEKHTTIRNNCNAAGYESVGLFPIKTREENIGLIQLNDKRTDMFDAEMIEYLEMIGEQIGVAIENALLYEQIKNKNTELENTVNQLNEMQAQLVEAKKMTALADLVTGVAHEVYQPINQSLHTLEGIIRKTKDSSDNSNNQDGLIAEQKSIYEMLSNARALIKSFRSIAFDQFQESRHLINISGFLSDIIRVVKPSLTGKTIDFQIECSQTSEIMSYTGILSQVLSILIQNSYHHGYKDVKEGVIVLGCGIVDEDTIELSVADRGCGINENITHKLFEPFFTTDRKNYTGLGLHAARNLVENKLKGTIELDKKISDGTRWIIHIPA